ncbi:hypothetical protein GQ43DRAFT_487809 [Delitschia confertaspora ATCC 74209]|uniref:Uncharacterized protein n=1 Tax=Delitschia confertaspora ATCC 74209 TaxID=1513339 RepID=A0A9P4JQG2_9PLEO|nr:hypothetical protein GQ43DRAFT_487809 [Delitschia confertaspora ATCC 74209]
MMDGARGVLKLTWLIPPYPSNRSCWNSAGRKGEDVAFTIPESPPFLNWIDEGFIAIPTWIYLDSSTSEVKYGVRNQVKLSLTGS